VAAFRLSQNPSWTRPGSPGIPVSFATVRTSASLKPVFEPPLKTTSTAFGVPITVAVAA